MGMAKHTVQPPVYTQPAHFISLPLFFPHGGSFPDPCPSPKHPHAELCRLPKCSSLHPTSPAVTLSPLPAPQADPTETLYSSNVCHPGPQG